MRLIFDVLTSKEDKEVLEGDKTEEIVDDLRNISDDLVKDHVALLAWMLDKGRLEIKIASGEGIVHSKIGILSDDAGNRISFDGSINETLQGWKTNIEEIKVYRAWVKGQKPFVERNQDTFKRYWHGRSDKVRVYPLDEAVRKELLRYKPSDEGEKDEVVERIRREMQHSKKGGKKKPRSYQEKAIAGWKRNGRRGIWSMATGTGKTLTAIWGLEDLIESSDGMCVVIVCPFSHLLEQWRESIKEETEFRPISTQDRDWEGRFQDAVHDIAMAGRDQVILLTTYAMYHRPDFRETISSMDVEKALVADEVHHAGAPMHSNGLIEDYQYRLGLSATPERYMDEAGSEKLLDYFGGVVFEYGLERAIEEGYLSEYDYHVDFVKLTEDELDQYRQYTQKIGPLMAQESLSESEKESLQGLLIQRSRVVKKAENKMDALRGLIEDVDKVEKSIFFCEDSEQVEKVEAVLNDNLVKFAEFTDSESNKEREKRAENLKKGSIDALVAMNVLDEGFDLPAAHTAFLLASTGNPAQYIQRRGRVLRKTGSSDVADIYDLLVIPGMERDYYVPSDEERSVIEKELRRLRIFAGAARNKESELEAVIDKVQEKYGIGKD